MVAKQGNNETDIISYVFSKLLWRMFFTIWKFFQKNKKNFVILLTMFRKTYSRCNKDEFCALIYSFVVHQIVRVVHVRFLYPSNPRKRSEHIVIKNTIISPPLGDVTDPWVRRGYTCLPHYPHRISTRPRWVGALWMGLWNWEHGNHKYWEKNNPKRLIMNAKNICSKNIVYLLRYIYILLLLCRQPTYSWHPFFSQFTSIYSRSH